MHASKARLVALLALMNGIVFESANANSLVVTWDNAILESIRTTRPGPPMTSRMLSVTHTCMYDAWAAYTEKALATELPESLRRPAAERTVLNKEKAINYAALRCLSDLFPTRVDAFNALSLSLGYDPKDQSVDPTKPQGIGNLAAKAVLDFRHNDGSNQLGNLHPGAYSDYTGYQAVNSSTEIKDPNLWQPLATTTGQQSFVGAQWYKVIPYALTSGDQFLAKLPKPATYDTSRPNSPLSRRYVQQANDILRFSANLTDEQKAIAEYWADGPNSEFPPGHWALISQFVSNRDSYDLDKDVKLFFAVTNAVFDGGVAAWTAKRTFNSVRPITAIHYLYGGKTVKAWAGAGLGTQSIDGATWSPYQQKTQLTPPFAEYISGHSTFSGSAAETLRRFTGSDNYGAMVTIPQGSSKVEPGQSPMAPVTLSWKTFTAAANQAGISRLYGGIHFHDGDIRGRKMGELVGKNAWLKTLVYFNGV